MAKQQFILSGTTIERPIVSTIGFRYFDKDLGVPIWWDGTQWLILNNIPDASTTVKGISELATQTEVNDGVNTTNSVTPETLANSSRIVSAIGAGLTSTDGGQLVGSLKRGAVVYNVVAGIQPTYPVTNAEVWTYNGANLQRTYSILKDRDTNDLYIQSYDGAGLGLGWVKIGVQSDASETVKGIIELATQTEVNTGTDAVRAVTPATLQTKLNSFSPTIADASTTTKGIVELATNTETVTGTDTVRSTTPAGVQAKFDAFATYGTYTPIMTASTTNPTLTYTTQYGAWRKIGRLLQFEVRLEWTAITAAGSGSIGISLPEGRDISESNNAQIGGLAIGLCSGINITGGITATFLGTATGVRFYDYSGAIFTVSDMNSSGILLISGSYRTSS